MAKKNENAGKPAGSEWNSKIANQNTDPGATEAMREFMKEPNTPTQYRVGLNPTRPVNGKVAEGEILHEGPDNF